jgi:hypothetical protein
MEGKKENPWDDEKEEAEFPLRPEQGALVSALTGTSFLCGSGLWEIGKF